MPEFQKAWIFVLSIPSACLPNHKTPQSNPLTVTPVRHYMYEDQGDRSKSSMQSFCAVCLNTGKPKKKDTWNRRDFIHQVQWEFCSGHSFEVAIPNNGIEESYEKRNKRKLLCDHYDGWMCTGEDSQRTRVYLYAGFISTNGLAEPTRLARTDWRICVLFDMEWYRDVTCPTLRNVRQRHLCISDDIRLKRNTADRR